MDDRGLLGVCERFNRISWHDSKLLAAQILRSPGGQCDEVSLNVRLRVGPNGIQWKEARVRFKDCTLVLLDLDLAGKRVCGDDIATAYCERDSALKERIQRDRLRREPNALAAFLHFCVSLIYPGGQINIFAKDFELLFD